MATADLLQTGRRTRWTPAPTAPLPAIPQPPLPPPAEPAPKAPDPIVKPALVVAAPLGVEFLKEELLVAAGAALRSGVCRINPSSVLQKRNLFAYLWYEETDPAADSFFGAVINLYRNGMPMGQLPLEWYQKNDGSYQGQSAISFGGFTNVPFGYSMGVLPTSTQATEPSPSWVGQFPPFNSEIDALEINITKLVNVSGYRIILGCLSTNQ